MHFWDEVSKIGTAVGPVLTAGGIGAALWLGLGQRKLTNAQLKRLADETDERAKSQARLVSVEVQYAKSTAIATIHNLSTGPIYELNVDQLTMNDGAVAGVPRSRHFIGLLPADGTLQTRFGLLTTATGEVWEAPTSSEAIDVRYSFTDTNGSRWRRQGNSANVVRVTE